MIFESDDRIKIPTYMASQTGSYVQILSTYADGYTTQSSGVMIGSNDVLTAAHAIYDYEHYGYAQSVTVTPSKFGSYEPYLSVSANTIFVNDSWVYSNSMLSDYGVVSLSQPVGFYTGWLEYDYLSYQELLDGRTLTSYGYPGDLYYGDWLYSTEGTVDSIYNNYMLLFDDDLDAYFGQSGSPLISDDTVIGIVTSEFYDSNNILGLNKSSIKEITDWASLNNDELISFNAVLTLEESITSLYIAFFNRAPDENGLNYWLQEAHNLSNVSDVTKKIAEQFAATDTFTSTYSDMDNKSFIKAIYTNILGSSADNSGLEYWSTILDSGYSRAYMVDDIIMATLNVSLQSQEFAYLSYSEYQSASLRQNTFANKVEVAMAFTSLLDSHTNIGDIQNLSNDFSYMASQNILLNITDDYATVEKNIAFIGLITQNPFPMEDINVWIS